MMGYFIACALSALLLRRFVRVPTEVFRKVLHLILLCSLPVLVFGFRTWWASALSSLVFMAAAYPAIALGERIEGFSQLLTQRADGEIKRSLGVVFSMFAAMICLGWGWLGQRWLVLACVSPGGLETGRRRWWGRDSGSTA